MTTKKDRFLTLKNRKLEKDKIASFDLPAIKTCPNAKECKKYCYAAKCARIYKNYAAKLDRNLKLTKDKTFEHTMISDIIGSNREIVRIHSSGDFYNQAYLDKWISIMHQLPFIRFYFYTKSHNLDFSKMPRTATMIKSYGGKYDNLINPEKDIHAKVFLKSDKIPLNYSIGNNNDLLAIAGYTNIALIKH